MEFLKLAKDRFSVLEYTDQPVETVKLERILEAALAAPTACNNQPQRIVVINDEQSRQKLHRAVPGKYTVPLAFLVCYDSRDCWVRPVDGKSSGDIDASIVATHMMLEMTDLGLGSIWVMHWDPEKMRNEFSLEDGIVPVALLICGYKSDGAYPRKGHLESKKREEIVIA